MPEAKKSGRIFDNQTLTADTDSAVIDTKGQNIFSVTYKWTGALDGTLALEACNDTDQNAAGDGVGWVSIATFATSPGGSPGSNSEAFTNARHRYYKVTFTHTADGILTMVVNTDNGGTAI